jgi:polyphosphate kinase 2 (PPK2 family)
VENLTAEFWENRFESINAFERHLANNGVIIIKFFLHLSKEEQRQRLLRRLETEKHNWKFSPGDLKERELWDKYQECYEDIMNKTSKAHAPWFIVPADNKETARYIVAKTMLDELNKYEFHYPELEQEIQDNIKMYHDKLSSEK